MSFGISSYRRMLFQIQKYLVEFSSVSQYLGGVEKSCLIFVFIFIKDKDNHTISLKIVPQKSKWLITMNVESVFAKCNGR